MVDRKKTARDYSQAYLRDRRPLRPWNWMADGIVAVAIVVLIVLAFAFAGKSARGAEPERERNARVALALAHPGKTAETRDRNVRAAIALTEAASAPVATAPPPKVKSLCTCGDDCKCMPGVCPACPSVKKEVSRLRDSLVRVRTSRGSGSGTVIWSGSGQSVVLTAYHVVETGDTLQVRAEARWHAAQVLGYDGDGDVAALLVEVELPAVPVAEADPKDGADVLMLGCTSIWSKGKISGREGLRYFITCETGAGDFSDSGDSGGGVFHGGELIGVHCGRKGLTEATALPYCASVKPIRGLFARVFKRDGDRLSPIAVKSAPKTVPAAEYDLWLVNGEYMYVPKGQRPSCSTCPSCPNGRCPLPR